MQKYARDEESARVLVGRLDGSDQEVDDFLLVVRFGDAGDVAVGRRDEQAIIASGEEERNFAERQQFGNGIAGEVAQVDVQYGGVEKEGGLDQFCCRCDRRRGTDDYSAD